MRCDDATARRVAEILPEILEIINRVEPEVRIMLHLMLTADFYRDCEPERLDFMLKGHVDIVKTIIEDETA